GGWQLGTAYEDWDLWMAFAERGWIGVRVRHIAEIHREHAGRRWAGVLVPAHNDAILRQRHSSLFEHRRSNWRRSRAPWRSKLMLPVIGRLAAPHRGRAKGTAAPPVPAPSRGWHSPSQTCRSRSHAGSRRFSARGLRLPGSRGQAARRRRSASPSRGRNRTGRGNSDRSIASRSKRRDRIPRPTVPRSGPCPPRLAAAPRRDETPAPPGGPWHRNRPGPPSVGRSAPAAAPTAGRPPPAWWPNASRIPATSVIHATPA